VGARLPGFHLIRQLLEEDPLAFYRLLNLKNVRADCVVESAVSGCDRYR